MLSTFAIAAIERVDSLVQCIGRQFGRQSPTLSHTVTLVDERLRANREGMTEDAVAA